MVCVCEGGEKLLEELTGARWRKALNAELLGLGLKGEL